MYTHRQSIVTRLEEACSNNLISEYNKRAVMELSSKVASSLAYKHSTIQEGVNQIMGGQILDYPAKDILNQGIALGIEQGISQGIDRGEAKMSSLIAKLIKQSRLNDIDRATEDPAYREQLYAEFDIE